MILLSLKITLLTVTWTLGWKVSISEGLWLEKLGKWGEAKVESGYKIFDGLIVCPWCVPNIHGLLFVWPLAFGLGVMPFEFNYKYFLIYPFCVCASSFISGFIWTIYLTLNSKKVSNEWASKYYENAQKYYYEQVKKIKDK